MMKIIKIYNFKTCKLTYLHVFFVFTNNKCMIYFVGFLVGMLNGLFAAGSGQVLVFYLIYILKLETHKVRALSVAILSISSIFAIFGYRTVIQYDILTIIALVIIAGVTGIIGTKIMKKIPSEILNLISGVLLVGLTLYKVFVKG